MANQERHRPGGDEWKGDEVADAPPGEAEAGADRAAGRGPVDARRAAQEREEAEEVEPAEPRGGGGLSKEDVRDQELKRQAAAEEHAADRAAGTGTAPKKI